MYSTHRVAHDRTLVGRVSLEARKRDGLHVPAGPDTVPWQVSWLRSVWDDNEARGEAAHGTLAGESMFTRHDSGDEGRS